jgi:hypothetical protein
MYSSVLLQVRKQKIKALHRPSQKLVNEHMTSRNIKLLFASCMHYDANLYGLRFRFIYSKDGVVIKYRVLCSPSVQPCTNTLY